MTVPILNDVEMKDQLTSDPVFLQSVILFVSPLQKQDGQTLETLRCIALKSLINKPLSRLAQVPAAADCHDSLFSSAYAAICNN